MPASTLFVLLSFVLSTSAAFAVPFRCPRVGGDLVVAQEVRGNALDEMASSSAASRNLVTNVYESLMTRDENNHPILDLAAAMDEAPDHLTYSFKLRQGIRFHNGKPMTSADIVASFDRYARVGERRSALANVDRWDAPDAATFVLHMKQVQPIFIEALSSYNVPIVILPAEQRDVPAQQLTQPIGTGPFEFVLSQPNGTLVLRRFGAYLPNASFQARTGLGGYKVACLETVTFRTIADPGARLAGLRAGEFQVIEDVPAKSVIELRQDSTITILPLKTWAIQLAGLNLSDPPTDNLLVRKAIQAALDMDKIMHAAADGDGELSVGFQHPGQPDYSDAGKETYNQHDPDLARTYLAEAGYQGEPVVLLTSEDCPPSYKAALAMQLQLQAVGINAQMKVVDGSTSARMMANSGIGWNLHFTEWRIQPALGALATMQSFVQPNASYRPKDGKDDPTLLAAWTDMNTLPTPQARRDAYARMQRLVLAQVDALPFGSLPEVQVIRSDVGGFVPFPISRFANVWLGH